MGLTATKELPIVLLRLEQIRLDGGTQARVEINHGTVSKYADCLDELPPVDVFFDGVTYWLAEGFHRYFAHKKKNQRGTIRCTKHIGTVRDAILFAVGANYKNALQLSDADLRHACRMLLTDAEWGRWSDKEIARQCKVSPWLVGDERKKLREEEKERREKEKAAAERAMEKARQEEEAKKAAERAKVKEGWVRPGKREEPAKLAPVNNSHFKASDSEDSETETEVRTYRTKHGTMAQMKTGNIGKGRDRNVVRPERDEGEKKKIHNQLIRSIPKAIKQAKKLGLTWEQYIEECRKVWDSIPVAG